MCGSSLHCQTGGRFVSVVLNPCLGCARAGGGSSSHITGSSKADLIHTFKTWLALIDGGLYLAFSVFVPSKFMQHLSTQWHDKTICRLNSLNFESTNQSRRSSATMQHIKHFDQSIHFGPWTISIQARTDAFKQKLNNLRRINKVRRMTAVRL